MSRREAIQYKRGDDFPPIIVPPASLFADNDRGWPHGATLLSHVMEGKVLTVSQGQESISGIIIR